jgi:hypothetical protein
MGDAVDAYLERFRSLGLDGSPCSASEVEQVEHHLGVSLPAAYKAYLRIAGTGPPAAWVGSDCTVRHLPGLRGGAERLLRECGQPPLPEAAFVFLMHQGYQFFYLLADGSSDDPSVFYYLEGEPQVVRRFDRFSDLVVVVAGQAGDV